MAGDWIKIEHATAGKAEVLKMARMLDIKRREMIGLLVDFFVWCDTNCVDGFVDGVVDHDVDSIMACAGFSAVMRDVGWLKFHDSPAAMEMVNWHSHNGISAKKRALKNDAQKKWRSKAGKNVDASVDHARSTKASTREEKRYISNTDVLDIKREALFADVDPVIAKDWQAMRKQKKAAVTKTAVDGIRSEARKAGISLQDALAICCQRGWVGFKAEWVAEARAPPGMSHKDAERKKFFDSIHGQQHANQPIDITPERVD